MSAARGVARVVAVSLLTGLAIACGGGGGSGSHPPPLVDASGVWIGGYQSGGAGGSGVLLLDLRQATDGAVDAEAQIGPDNSWGLDGRVSDYALSLWRDLGDGGIDIHGTVDPVAFTAAGSYEVSGEGADDGSWSAHRVPTASFQVEALFTLDSEVEAMAWVGDGLWLAMGGGSAEAGAICPFTTGGVKGTCFTPASGYDELRDVTSITSDGATVWAFDNNWELWRLSPVDGSVLGHAGCPSTGRLMHCALAYDGSDVRCADTAGDLETIDAACSTTISGSLPLTGFIQMAWLDGSFWASSQLFDKLLRADGTGAVSGAAPLPAMDMYDQLAGVTSDGEHLYAVVSRAAYAEGAVAYGATVYRLTPEP